MELTQYSLLEELIMAPNTDSSFPTELFQNTWNFTPFDQTPDFHLPVTNPSLLDLISPADFTNPCPFGEFQPFLDTLTSPELGTFYDKDDLPAMAIPEDYATHLEIGESLFLDNGLEGGISSFKVESSQMNDNINIDVYSNVGVYTQKKSKSKKPDGQPSKNLMAERRRRKRLNDRLSMLRSIVPKISKMDRTSILGDTIDYMRELLDKIDKLRDEEGTAIRNFFHNHEMQLRNPPKFEVERRSEDTQIEVCCAAKPGLLLSTLSTLDALGLDVQQCVISCFNDFSVQASCYEAVEQRSVVSSEDVKQALFRNAGYGGRCL